MDKYLSEADIYKLLGDITIPEDFNLMSQDSYNESLILKSIKSTGKETELLQATLNLAIVGYGNKNFGSFSNGNNVTNIALLFKQCNVKINNNSNTLLGEGELTPNRLCRFFRHHIRKFLSERKIASYLYRKYSTHKEEFADICFRGAEFLDDLTDEQQKYLLETVLTMDTRLNTRIQERVLRVFAAKRGTQLLLTPIKPSTTSTTNTTLKTSMT